MPTRQHAPFKCSSLLSLICFMGICFVLSACESNSDNVFNGASQEDLADAFSYKTDGPWASALKPCILAKSVEEACSLETLPLIGMTNAYPSVEDILNRVVVSHDWMGERIEDIFTTLPLEFRLLARSVTAIIIDDDIRPAYYDVNTGAIYLDANFLWLSVAEAQTINPKDDFRSGFSRPLDFRSFGRYVKDHQAAYQYFSPDNPSPRALSDIEHLIGSLLLHELAHANDYFPPELHNQLNESQKPWPASLDIQTGWVATRLANSQGLGSRTMYDLARVMFHGDTASDNLKMISPAEAAGEFSPDGASDTYAYSSEREDVAMLFEEVLMYHLFEVERDVVFTTAPETENSNCEDYQVAWGARMRVSTTQVSTRAEFVVNEILPELDAQSVVAALPQTREMPDGLDWCNSILFEQSNQNGLQKTTVEGFIETPFYH